MIVCSCFTYMYKNVRGEDPFFTGWGCPWIFSMLEHPVSEDPGNGVFCYVCGDRLMPNGDIIKMQRNDKENLYIEQIKIKNMKTHQNYKEHKKGGFKGLSGLKGEINE